MSAAPTNQELIRLLNEEIVRLEVELDSLKQERDKRVSYEEFKATLEAQEQAGKDSDEQKTAEDKGAEARIASTGKVTTVTELTDSLRAAILADPDEMPVEVLDRPQGAGAGWGGWDRAIAMQCHGAKLTRGTVRLFCGRQPQPKPEPEETEEEEMTFVRADGGPATPFLPATITLSPPSPSPRPDPARPQPMTLLEAVDQEYERLTGQKPEDKEW
ncbi:hypothetical protein F4780DRAFT_779275 [Xylariomycetidae sp. FL0641]|nr:hypothetical protein F4780DRAFT_779275 [Xylariomycetidae sp. FL0641]